MWFPEEMSNILSLAAAEVAEEVGLMLTVPAAAAQAVIGLVADSLSHHRHTQ